MTRTLLDKTADKAIRRVDAQAREKKRIERIMKDKAEKAANAKGYEFKCQK